MQLAFLFTQHEYYAYCKLSVRESSITSEDQQYWIIMSEIKLFSFLAMLECDIVFLGFQDFPSLKSQLPLPLSLTDFSWAELNLLHGTQIFSSPNQFDELSHRRLSSRRGLKYCTSFLVSEKCIHNQNVFIPLFNSIARLHGDKVIAILPVTEELGSSHEETYVINLNSSFHFHGILSVINFDSKTGLINQIALACYSCMQNTIDFRISVVPGQLNSLNTVQIYHEKANSRGNGLIPLHMKSDDIQQFFFEKLPHNKRLYYCEKYFPSEIDCEPQRVLWLILLQKLNVTVSLIDDFFTDEDDFPLSSYLCSDCRPSEEEIIKTKYHLFYLDDRKTQLVYCEYKVNYSSPSWLFFITPFDEYIWIGIFIVTILVGITLRNKKYSISILLLLINQNFYNHRWHLQTFPIIISLLFISYEYQGSLTTSVIAPLKPNSIELNQELFDAGYRLVLPSKSLIDPIALQFGHFLKRLLRRNEITNEDFIIDPALNFLSKQPQFHWWPILAKKKGITLGFKEMSRFLQQVEFNNGKTGKLYESYTCHFVKEILDNVAMKWVARSFLSKTIYNILNQLNAANIARWLYMAQTEKVFKSMGKLSTNNDMDETDSKSNDIQNQLGNNKQSTTKMKIIETHKFTPIAWNSSFSILIYWFTILIALSTICFSGEKCLH